MIIKEFFLKGAIKPLPHGCWGFNLRVGPRRAIVLSTVVFRGTPTLVLETAKTFVSKALKGDFILSNAILMTLYSHTGR
jgi:hypothetical protein